MLLCLRSLFLSLVVVCCLFASSFAAPVVLFDESHAQQFLIGKSGPLDLSDLAAFYQANDMVVLSHADGLTTETLAAVDVLVLSGPFKDLTPSEIDAVINFIEDGGGVAVMLHVAPLVSDFLRRLEVDFTNGSLRESKTAIDENPLNFKVTTMADHPVTKGLESFSLYGAWALRGTAQQARILAETTQFGWVDLNRDNKLSEGDAVQQFGVMIGGELGSGRYVVLGDDALFQNRFFDEPNKQLALQLMNWLSAR